MANKQNSHRSRLDTKGDDEVVKQFIPIAITRHFTQEYHTKLEIQDNSGKVYSMCVGDHGTINFNNNNVYDGDLVNGLFHGRGKLHLAEQNMLYYGEFDRNSIQNIGKLVYPDLKIYEGQFKNGMKHGCGILYDKNQQVIYQGQWKYSKRHGNGKLFMKDGTTYTGQFENNQKQGFGVLTYASGNEFKGFFINGQKQGVGKMVWNFSKMLQNHSFGTQQLNPGQQAENQKKMMPPSMMFMSQLQTETDQMYEGQWLNNQMHGLGELTWLEDPKALKATFKNRYSGQFYRNLREGLGSFYYADGSIYMGQWKGNKKEGYGMYQKATGQVFLYFFENDKKMKELPILTSFYQQMASQMDQIIEHLSLIQESQIQDQLGANKLTSNSQNDDFKNVGSTPLPGETGPQSEEDPENQDRRRNRQKILGDQATKPTPRYGGAQNQRIKLTTQEKMYQHQQDVEKQNQKMEIELRGTMVSFSNREQRNPYTFIIEISDLLNFYSNYQNSKNPNFTRRRSIASPLRDGQQQFSNISNTTNMISDLQNQGKGILSLNNLQKNYNVKQIETEIKEVLMRHHSSLQKTYKHLTSLQDKELGQYMTLKTMQCLFQKVKVFNGKLNYFTLASNLFRAQTMIDLLTNKYNQDRITPVSRLNGIHFEEVQTRKTVSFIERAFQKQMAEQKVKEEEERRIQEMEQNLLSQQGSQIQQQGQEKTERSQITQESQNKGSKESNIKVEIKRPVSEDLTTSQDAADDRGSVTQGYNQIEQLQEELVALLLFDLDTLQQTEKEILYDENVDNKPVLYKDFVNLLIRAIFIKNGFSLNNFPQKLDLFFKQRLFLITSGQMEAKQLIHEEKVIMQRSKKSIEKNTDLIKELFDTLVGLEVSSTQRKNRSILVNSIIEFFRYTRVFDYAQADDKLLLWKILERNSDPEESLFRWLIKLQNFKRGEEKYAKQINALLLIKLYDEISFDEFKEILIISLCKKKNINPKHSVYEKKMNNTIVEFIQKAKEVVANSKRFQGKRMKKVRYFQPTKKDFELQNIEKINKEKLKLQELKKTKLEEVKRQKEERLLFKKEDYDVTDFLLKQKFCTEEPEEDEETEEDLFDDDTSFFVYKQKSAKESKLIP